MDERARVRRAIEGPVDEAAKLLDSSSSADVETRLTILINGWGRGLAAGIEELAVAVRDLRSSFAEVPESSSREPSSRPQSADVTETDDEGEGGEAQKLADANESELREQAERSREATEALREEASSDRGDD